MKQYLFLFTIGPVKDFISQSRKSQDLFAASALLSYLTGIAIEKAIAEFQQGNDIIITPFPKSIYKPNRFVAKIEFKNELDLKKIGENIENEVKTAFKAIGNIPFKNGFIKPFGFDEQLDDFLEVFWLYCPIEKDYKTAYRKLFQELASLKSITPFTKFEETGRNCSVDGKYNIKVYRKNFIKKTGEEKLEIYEKNGIKRYSKLYQEITGVNVIGCQNNEHLSIWHIQEGEGISAISLIKRIFNPLKPTRLSEPHKFPSTAKISLMNWIDKVKDLNEFKGYSEKVICEKKSKNNIFSHSDDQLYYRDNIEQIVNNIDNTKTQEVISLHKVITDKMVDAKITEPFTKYYALIRFDGDNMGDWLLGDLLIDEVNMEEFHREFSKCVDCFATKINKFITAPRGQVIYAGGEDFMAMVNIHHLFNVMNEIRILFRTEINDKLASFKKDSNQEMTISLGIAIAHYKQPLPMVLDRAKEMENKAKYSGRIRFAIGIMKHSGNVLETILPWNIDSKETLTDLIDVFSNIENDNFSTAFVRNIYDGFEKCGFEMPEYLVESKIKLYVPQAINVEDKSGAKKSRMIKNVTNLSKISNNNDFGNLLLILDFLIRKTAQ